MSLVVQEHLYNPRPGGASKGGRRVRLNEGTVSPHLPVYCPFALEVSQGIDGGPSSPGATLPWAPPLVHLAGERELISDCPLYHLPWRVQERDGLVRLRRGPAGNISLGAEVIPSCMLFRDQGVHGSITPSQSEWFSQPG